MYFWENINLKQKLYTIKWSVTKKDAEKCKKKLWMMDDLHIAEHKRFLKGGNHLKSVK